MAHTAVQYQNAITEGIKLFMRKGFVNVSIDDIVSVTGLNRYAIYSAFGAKLDFFRACVQNYCDQAINSLELLTCDESIDPRDAARRNLYSAAQEMCTVQSGCLVCENVTDMKEYAPDIAAYCIDYYCTKEALLLKLFVRAHDMGLLAAQLDPEVAASTFLVFKFGLSNEVKRNPDIGSMTRKIDSFVDVIFTDANRL